MNNIKKNYLNQIDIHIGKQVRKRRIFLKISQQKLAEELGVTFQQIQKYENASNRISASKLYCIQKYLKVSAVYFFKDLDNSYF